MEEAEEARVVDALVLNLYEVVPEEYQTHCTLTSRIAKSALNAMGIVADLQPCQIWYATATHSYVIGFSGRPLVPGKWDGHVICMTKFHFIDAATHHFKRDFGLAVPRVVAGRRFLVPGHVMGRVDLGADNHLWWHEPPEDVDTTPPDAPSELIEVYASKLTQILQAH